MGTCTPQDSQFCRLHPTPLFPADLSAASEEESGLRPLINARTLKGHVEREKQQQEEDSEFKKQLEAKSLKEVMELRQHLQEEIESKKSVLDSVKAGNLSSLTPYFIQGADSTATISSDSVEKENAVIAEKHLRNEKSVTEYKGHDPALALETERKWLRETFPTERTDAILVKDDKGNIFIASLGVSVEEIDAARGLQVQRLRAEKQSAEVTTHLQERIKHESQNLSKDTGGETVAATATPRVQDESSRLKPVRHAP